MHILMTTNNFPISDLIGKGNQCIGVDVAASAVAPRDKVTGNSLGLDGPDALVLKAMECLIRGGFPFTESFVPVTVRENLTK